MKFPKGIASTDLRLTRGSKLKARLAVFENGAQMRREWKQCFKEHLGRKTVGAVKSLALDVITAEGLEYTEHPNADYYCFIGLIKGYLSMEIVCHESVHAGFAYAERVNRDIFPSEGDEEERIAYPAGKVARQINRWLHKNGYYEKD